MDSRLTDMARAEIDALAADGITPTPQEVLDIQRLSIDCTAPDSATGSIARGRPTKLGDETIWPPTIAAASFFAEVSTIAADDAERFFALLYACRFGRDADRIYRRGAEALADVREWRGRIRATADEAVEAMERITADEPPAPEGREPDISATADMALRAAALAGGSPEMWETQCSIRSVARVLDIIWAQKLAENKSAKGDPRIVAVRRLGEYVLALKKSRKEADHG